MSAGAFSRSRYEADSGDIHPIRIQPETEEAQIGSIVNDRPLGEPTNPISAQVSASTRSLGLHARKVFAKLLGAPPAGYAASGRIAIPALTNAFYSEAVKVATMTYLGTSWTVTGRRAEVVR